MAAVLKFLKSRTARAIVVSGVLWILKALSLEGDIALDPAQLDAALQLAMLFGLYYARNSKKEHTTDEDL